MTLMASNNIFYFNVVFMKIVFFNIILHQVKKLRPFLNFALFLKINLKSQSCLNLGSDNDISSDKYKN